MVAEKRNTFGNGREVIGNDYARKRYGEDSD